MNSVNSKNTKNSIGKLAMSVLMILNVLSKNNIEVDTYKTKFELEKVLSKEINNEIHDEYPASVKKAIASVFTHNRSKIISDLSV